MSNLTADQKRELSQRTVGTYFGKTDEEIKAEYDRINGIGAKDYGSRAVILKDVKRRARKLGYHVSGFNKMGRQQLYAINRDLERRCGE